MHPFALWIIYHESHNDLKDYSSFMIMVLPYTVVYFSFCDDNDIALRFSKTN